MMFKWILSGVVCAGLMAVSAASSAEILVNHHNQSYEEYIHQTSAHHSVRKVKKQRQHTRHAQRPRHHHSYSQHSKVVDTCLRIKHGQRYRVC